ncbi:MAG: hypothetical protein GY788_10685 [bacterium]|nr:hypothetical protein [bacterium]
MIDRCALSIRALLDGGPQMLRRLGIGLILALAFAGCGGDSGSTTTGAADTTVATTTAAPATTTEAVPESTTTTEPAPPSTTTTTVDSATPTISDGRPETFLAITDSYVAVEVDTATGEIVHSFGQTGTAEQMAAAEEIAPNVLVGIWRVRDGSMVGLSDCCEPAAGRIFYVEAGGELGSDPYAGPGIAGWTLSPSPVDNQFANLGYSMLVSDPNVSADFGPGQWIDEPDLGFPLGSAAWSRDGSELFWTTNQGDATGLATLDLAEGAPVPVAVLPWVGDTQYIDGIGSQASGNLVGFLHTQGGEFSTIESEGVVFTTSGQLLANFDAEVGSTWGGYDESGRFLIYTDSDGTVRWQGLGETGALGSGFFFASW